MTAEAANHGFVWAETAWALDHGKPIVVCKVDDVDPGFVDARLTEGQAAALVDLVNDDAGGVEAVRAIIRRYPRRRDG